MPLYLKRWMPPPNCMHSTCPGLNHSCIKVDLNLDAAELTMEQRAELARSELQTALDTLLESLLNEKKDGAQPVETDGADIQLDVNEHGDPQLTVDGETAEMTADLENLLSSMLQDFENIPDDWLEPADEGQYKEHTRGQDQQGNGWQQTAPETGTFLYDEWDYRRQTYRKNWCVLREHTAHPQLR